MKPINLSRMYDKKKFTFVSSGQNHTFAICKNNKRIYGWGNLSYFSLSSFQQSQLNYPTKIAQKSFYDQLEFCSNQAKEDAFHQFKQDIGEIYQSQEQLFLVQKKKLQPHEELTKNKQNALPFSYIASSDNFALFICKNIIFSLGQDNCTGRSGAKPNFNNLPPTIIQFNNNNIIKGVTCSRSHCMLWDENGILYSWGLATKGKLGHPQKNFKYDYIQETPIKILALQNHKIVQACCGLNHSIALTSEGQIYQWGEINYETQNTNIKLFTSQYTLQHLNKQNLSSQSDIESLKQRKYNLKSSDMIQSFINISDKEEKEQLSFYYQLQKQKEYYEEKENKDLAMPQLLSAIITQPYEYEVNPFIIKIACFDNHCLALDYQGNVYSWGINQENCLGFSNQISQLQSPTCIHELQQQRAIDIACGNKFSVVLLCDKTEESTSQGLKQFKQVNFQQIKQKIQNLREMTINNIQSEEDQPTVKSIQEIQKFNQNLKEKNNVIQNPNQEMKNQMNKINKNEEKVFQKIIYSTEGYGKALSHFHTLIQHEGQELTEYINNQQYEFQQKDLDYNDYIDIRDTKKTELQIEFQSKFNKKYQHYWNWKENDNYQSFSKIQKCNPRLIKNKNNQINNLNKSLNLNENNKKQLSNFEIKKNQIEKNLEKFKKDIQFMKGVIQQESKLEKKKNIMVRFDEQLEQIQAKLKGVKFNPDQYYEEEILEEQKLTSKEIFYMNQNQQSSELENSISQPNENQISQTKLQSSKKLISSQNLPSLNKISQKELGPLNKKFISQPQFTSHNNKVQTLITEEIQKQNNEKFIQQIAKISQEKTSEQVSIIQKMQNLNKELDLEIIQQYLNSNQQMAQKQMQEFQAQQLLTSPQSVQKIKPYFLQHRFYLSKENINRKTERQNSLNKKLRWRSISANQKKQKIIEDDKQRTVEIYYKRTKNSGVMNKQQLQIFNQKKYRVQHELFTFFNIELTLELFLSIITKQDGINKHIQEQVQLNLKQNIKILVKKIKSYIFKKFIYKKLITSYSKQEEQIVLEKSNEIIQKFFFTKDSRRRIKKKSIKFYLIWNKIIKVWDNFLLKINVSEGFIDKKLGNPFDSLQIESVQSKILTSPQSFHKKNQSKERFSIYQSSQQQPITNILPYTSHHSEIILPAKYKILITNITLHNQMLDELAFVEHKHKMKYIKKIWEFAKERYKENIQKYQKQMNEFEEQHIAQINLERAGMLLRTPIDKLKIKLLQEKSDSYQVFKKDHLPYPEFITPIAKSLKNCPTKPNMVILFDQFAFKREFEQYYQEFDDIYKNIIRRGQKLYQINLQRRKTKKN